MTKVPKDEICPQCGGLYTINYWSSYEDVWITGDNGATWTQKTSSAPYGMRSRCGIVVSASDDIFLIGGAGNGSILGDVWKSTDDGVNWTQLV